MQRMTTCAATAALIFALAGAAVAAPANTKKAAAPAGPVATQATTPKAAAPQLPPLNHGPAIPGLCIYTDQRAIALSNVGKAAGVRMKQLSAQVDAELQGEQTSLQTDASALRGKNVPETDPQWTTLRQRAQAFEAKVQQRRAELEATRAEALDQMHARVNDILRTVYQAQRCSILLQGEVVITTNPAMDVTDAVVTQLNAVMPTITFDRKVLPPQQQQQ